MDKLDLSFLHDIKTPLILAGLVVAVAIPIFNKLVQPGGGGAADGVQRQVARYIFILALVAIVLGAAGYVLDFFHVQPTGSAFHGKVVENGDVRNGVADATVHFQVAADSTVLSSPNGDFSFPFTQLEEGRPAKLWATRDGYKSSEVLQIVVGQVGVVSNPVQVSLIPNGSNTTTVQVTTSASTDPGATAAAPTAIDPSSGNFKEVYNVVKTNELDLSRWGESAFSVGKYDWAEKFLGQARAVQSSGVWQSDYPYYGAAMMLQGRDDAGKAALDEMLARIHTDIDQGHGYLGWQSTLGFVLQNLGQVRSKVSPADQAEVDQVIDKVTALKATARP